MSELGLTQATIYISRVELCEEQEEIYYVNWFMYKLGSRYRNIWLSIGKDCPFLSAPRDYSIRYGLLVITSTDTPHITYSSPHQATVEATRLVIWDNGVGTWRIAYSRQDKPPRLCLSTGVASASAGNRRVRYEKTACYRLDAL